MTSIKKLLLISIIFLTACANPGIVKLSPDTYMLSRADRGGIFGNAAAMKVEVIQEANDFAEKQGKVAIPLGLKEIPLSPGRLAQVEYQFRVVDRSDPEVKRVSLVPRPDVVIEKNEKSKVDVSSKNDDIYEKLIKLDDLRKKGIISNSEFDSEKKKVLGN
jgi:hypothetical protein